MKLQKNFTTVEQSKRLLKLGVPANSADCCLRRVVEDSGDSEYWRIDIFSFIGEVYDDFLPCWSIGRLMEIFDICKREDVRITFLMPSETINYIDYLIDILSCKWLDFSKLED